MHKLLQIRHLSVPGSGRVSLRVYSKALRRWPLWSKCFALSLPGYLTTLKRGSGKTPNCSL
jgi:hypothetical protein